MLSAFIDRLSEIDTSKSIILLQVCSFAGLSVGQNHSLNILIFPLLNLVNCTEYLMSIFPSDAIFQILYVQIITLCVSQSQSSIGVCE